MVDEAQCFSIIDRKQTHGIASDELEEGFN
jgi:hypothetical protein